MAIKLSNPFKKQLPETPKGKLLVIDGCDSSLTQKQVQFLYQALSDSGFKVLLMEFPLYGTDSSKLLEQYEKGELKNISLRAAAIFYSLDHFSAAERITNWINEGGVVIVRNYVSRIAGELGAKTNEHLERVNFFKWLNTLEFEVLNIPKPDLTIIIDNPKIQSEIRKSFQGFAKLYPNTKLVNLGPFSQNSQNIHNQIWELVRRIVLKNRLT